MHCFLVLLLPLVGCTITRVTQTPEPRECLEIVPSPDYWHPSGGYEVTLVSGDTLRPDFGELVWGRDTTVWMRYDFGHPWLESDHTSIAEPVDTVSGVVRRHNLSNRLPYSMLAGAVGMFATLATRGTRDPETGSTVYSVADSRAALGMAFVSASVSFAVLSGPTKEDRCEVVR